MKTGHNQAAAETDLMPLISCVIVSYNHARTIARSIESLFNTRYPGLSIVVIDNASTDGTLDVLRQFPGIRVLKNSVNTGFCAGMNRGISLSGDRHILALNPDAYLDPRALDTLAGTLAETKFGIITPKILRDETEIDCAGIERVWMGFFRNRGEGLKDHGQFDREEVVFGASAACALFRRQMLEAVRVNGQYFDEDFFAYKDDVDLSWRSNKAGFAVYYQPRAVAYHDRRIRSRPRSCDERIFERVAGNLRYILVHKKDAYFRNIRAISFRNDFFLWAKHFSWRENPADLIAFFSKLFIMLLAYLIAEPYVFRQTAGILRMMPRMIAKRKER